MRVLFAIGLIILILGVVGFFTHVVAAGIGAVVLGAVVMLVARLVGGRQATNL